MKENSKFDYEDMKNLFLDEIIEMERKTKKIENQTIALQVGAMGCATFAYLYEPLFFGTLCGCLGGVTSLCNYIALKRTQKIKNNLSKAFYQFKNGVSYENTIKYNDTLGKHNNKLILIALSGLSVGGLMAGYSLGDIFLNGDYKSLVGLGLGALTVYGASKLYKEKTQRFGESLKLNHNEENIK